jgi:DNA polymerase-4
LSAAAPPYNAMTGRHQAGDAEGEALLDVAGGRAEEAARQRKIIHIDMDAFFASVEQRDNPALRGKPVAVGGGHERGVVAAASYEARKFGVHSAMASVTALRKCPDLLFVKPRFDVYKEISLQIRAIFAEHTSIIEPLSLDEAYLDVTETLKAMSSATRIAEEIRARIRADTHLTASAGVSYNKFLAKLASDQRKPDGIFVITPTMGAAFVKDLGITKFHGVGPATASKMNRLGIFTGHDLRGWTLSNLRANFGKSGAFFYAIARGVDHRPVRADRIRKSIGAENTFAQDLTAFDEMRERLQTLVDKVWRFCADSGLQGRTVTLKVKYADFEQITRSRSIAVGIVGRDELERISYELLQPLFPMKKGVRLLGVSLSSLTDEAAKDNPQLRLWF